MAWRKIDKTDWAFFFDLVEASLLGRSAEVELASLAIGDPGAAHWLPLLGIRYDPRRDSIEIRIDGHEHRVRRPREIYVDDRSLGWPSLGLLGADGVEVVRLRELRLLPAPRG